MEDGNSGKSRRIFDMSTDVIEHHKCASNMPGYVYSTSIESEF